MAVDISTTVLQKAWQNCMSGYHLVRTSGGTVYAAVEDTDGSVAIYKANADPPTSFTEQDASNNPSNSLFESAAIAIDSNDIIHVIWYDDQSGKDNASIQYETFDTSDDTWSQTTETVSTLTKDTTFTFDNAQSICISIDANDDPHVTWTDYLKVMGSPSLSRLYSNRIGGTPWSTRVILRQDTLAGQGSFGMQLLIGIPTTAIGSDRPIFSDAEQGNPPEVDIFHGNALDATSFVVKDDVTDPAGPRNESYIGMAIDEDNFVSVYYGDFTTSDLNFVRHDPADAWSTWSSVQSVTSSGDNLNISAVAIFDETYILCRQAGDNDIHGFQEKGRGAGFNSFTAGPLPEVGTFDFPSFKTGKYNNNGITEFLDYAWHENSTDTGMYNRVRPPQRLTHTTNSFLETVVKEITHTTDLLKKAVRQISVDEMNQSVQGNRNLVSNGTDLYYFRGTNLGAGLDALRCYKSTDTGKTWAEQDSANALVDNNIGAISAAIDSTGIVHTVSMIASSTPLLTREKRFNTNTDLWIAGTDLINTSTVSITAAQLATAIVIDQNDDPHCAFLESVAGIRELHYANKIGGTWQTPIVVDSSVINENIDMCLDDRGFPIIVFRQLTSTETHAEFGNALDATSFTNFVISTNSAGITMGIAKDQDGDMVVMWREGTNQLSTRRHNAGDAIGTWQTTKNVAGTTTNLIRSALGVKGKTFYIMTNFDTPTENVRLYREINDGGWTLQETDNTLREQTDKGAIVNASIMRWAEFNEPWGEQMDIGYDITGDRLAWHGFYPANNTTHTTNSLLAVSGAAVVTVTHDTDALLEKHIELTHTTDALLQKHIELTHTTDSLLLSHETRTHTTDSLLKKFGIEVAHTTDSLLKKLGIEVTHTTDALLEKHIELTHTTDSFLRKTVELVHTTDSLLKKFDILVTHTTDALKKKFDILVTHTTDAVLVKRITVAHTTDSLLEKHIELAHTTDSSLLKIQTLTHTTDSLLKKIQTLTHTTDSLLKKTQTVTHTTDASLLKHIEITHTTDSFLKKAVAHSTDSFLKRAIAHSTDALLLAHQELTHTTDALIKLRISLPHTTDSLLKKFDILVTHTTDSLLLKIQTLTHTTDALLLKIQTLTHTTDSFLRKTIELTHTTDSLLKKFGIIVTHTTDALLLKIQTLTHTTDALLLKIQTLTHTTDSLLKKLGILVTHTTDALLKKLDQTVTHTTDALLKKTQTVTHTTDSLLKKLGQTLTHTTDARLATLGITHTTDALLKRGVKHLTDALLESHEERTHTTDAKLVLDVAVTHTTDSLLTRGVFHTTSSRLATKNVIVSSIQLEIPGTVPVRLTHTTDAKLVGKNLRTHTTDAKLITNLTTLSHSTNSRLSSGDQIIVSSIQFEIPLKAPLRLTHTTDALLRVGTKVFHLTNAFLAFTPGIIHTTDALLQRVDNLKTHTTDAFLQKFQTVTHTTNALLKKLGQLVTHTTDTFLEDRVRVTHTTDALLKKFGVIVSHTTDSAIQRVDNLLTHTTDAFLNKLRTLTHTTDSLLKDLEVIVTHTTDALLAGLGRTLTHTTDATLQEAGTLTHTTDAYIQVKEAAAFNILAFKREERRTLPFQREERNTLTFQRAERENVAFQ